MSNWTRRKKIGKSRSSANTVVTKYTMPAKTAKEIRKQGTVHGGQGRALQVATEILKCMHRPPEVEPVSHLRAPGFVRISMRLRKRTFKMIQDLAIQEYNDDPGQVISACAKVLHLLQVKRLRL